MIVQRLNLNSFMTESERSWGIIMARKIVIIDAKDYTQIIEYLLSAKVVLGRMRNSQNRNNTMYLLDNIQDLLTKDDDIVQRVDALERVVDY
jgi:hypothetical protein